MVCSTSHPSVSTLECSVRIVWCTNLDEVVLSQITHCYFALTGSDNFFFVVCLFLTTASSSSTTTYF